MDRRKTRQHADGVVIPGLQFRFVPRELATKCHLLVESFHDLHGYVTLPDMLWQSEARDIIESQRELTTMFKQASRSRGARRVNDSLVVIATVIVSMEVLARDFADWGQRFPAAKREAERMLADIPPQRHTWLMDMYLFPYHGLRRDSTRRQQSTRPGKIPTSPVRR